MMASELSKASVAYSRDPSAETARPQGRVVDAVTNGDPGATVTFPLSGTTSNTAISSLNGLATYTRDPSGLTTTDVKSPDPTFTVCTTAFVIVSMTRRLPSVCTA